MNGRIIFLFLFLVSLTSMVSASSGYINEIQFSNSNGIFTLSENPSATVKIVNPLGGNSYTARVEFSVTAPTKQAFTTYTNEYSMKPDNTYSAGFNLKNTLQQGIGIYNVGAKIQEKKCFIICWWSDVYTYTEQYGATFDKPSGMDNYLADNKYYHPSNSYIRSITLSAITEQTDTAITTPTQAMETLSKWVNSYVTYCSSPDYDNCNDRCDGDNSYCGGWSSDYWILYDKKGDCNDFSDLYISLARSINIPSRTMWVDWYTLDDPRYRQYEDYSLPMKGTPSAHAIAESYYGKWYHVDPTWSGAFNNPSIVLGNPSGHVVVRAWNEGFSFLEDDFCLAKYGTYCFSGFNVPDKGWSDATRERAYDSNWKVQQLKDVENVPTKAYVGQSYEPEIWLENLGDISIENAKLEISYSDGLELVSGPTKKDIGRIYSQTYDYTGWEFYVNKNGTQTMTIKLDFDNVPDKVYNYNIASTFDSNFTPPNISLEYLSVRNETVVNQSQWLAVGLSNMGDMKARNVSLKLVAPNGIEILNDAPSIIYTDIRGSGYYYAYWNIRPVEAGDYSENTYVEVYMNPDQNGGFEFYKKIPLNIKVYSGNIKFYNNSIEASIDQPITLETEIKNDGFSKTDYYAYSGVYKEDTQKYLAWDYDEFDNVLVNQTKEGSFTFYPDKTWEPGQDYLIYADLYCNFDSGYSSLCSSAILNLTIKPSVKINAEINIPEEVHKGNYFLATLNITNDGNVYTRCVRNKIILPNGLNLSDWDSDTKLIDLGFDETREVSWWVYVDKSGSYEVETETDIDPSCEGNSINPIANSETTNVKSGQLNISLENKDYTINEDMKVKIEILNDGDTPNNYFVYGGLGYWKDLSVDYTTQFNTTFINPGNKYQKEIVFPANSSRELGDYALFIVLADITGNYQYGFIIENVSLIKKDFIINSPESKIYNERSIPINISFDGSFAKLTYVDLDDKYLRERSLCPNCGEYGSLRKKTKSFSDGEHNITFNLIRNNLLVSNVTTSFFIDSKEPRISKTEPKRNAFTNGSGFYIKVKEDNLKNITITFNPTINLDLNKCTESRGYFECYIDLNLTSYNDQEIEYYFGVEDIAGNKDESKPTSIKVDTASPVLNNPNSFWSRGEGRYSNYIYFDMSIDEKNFDEVVLSYDYRGRTKEKRLCSRLKYGKCEYKFRLNDAYSNYELIIRDDAGNVDSREIGF